jgi:hypothetical protein
MRWDARGTVALFASALVGVVAGVVVGLSTGSPEAGNADPPGGPTGSPSASGSAQDPLGLGVPLQNLDCTGEKILVVGWGEEQDAGELYNAVSANGTNDVKYLETSKSCNTLYGEANQVPPTYVAYLGPYDTIRDPCAMQMTSAHARDFVTNLKPGVKLHVQCLCVLVPATFPKLKVGMHATTKDGVYIRALQQLLVDVDLLGPKRITGQYDEKTSRVVERLQELNAINAKPPGSVDELTWQMMRDKGCLTYDF